MSETVGSVIARRNVLLLVAEADAWPIAGQTRKANTNRHISANHTPSVLCCTLCGLLRRPAGTAASIHPFNTLLQSTNDRRISDSALDCDCDCRG